MASLSLPGGSWALQVAEAYSMCWGGHATRRWQSWQQGSYVHLRVAQARSYLPLKIQAWEGLWTLWLALSWKVFSLTSSDTTSSETLTPSRWLSSVDQLGILSHAVTSSRFLLYSLATRSRWKWEMQRLVPIKALCIFLLETSSFLQRKH